MRVTALFAGAMLWAGLLFADHHNVDFDRHTDFSKVKTFAMREGKGDSYQPELNNSLAVKKIADAIRAQLVSKGLKETFNSPDVLVDYSVTAEDFTEQRGGPVSSSEGTLVIDLVKRDSAALIWRSVYRDSERNPAKVAQNMPYDVKKSFAQYPPQQKGPIEPGPTTLTATPKPNPKAAAATALDIVRSTTADTAFVGPNAHPGLAISLGGLERAARAVSDDDGRSAAATTTKNIALFEAVKSSADYATSIASRNVESADSKEKSTALAAKLRAISGS